MATRVAWTRFSTMPEVTWQNLGASLRHRGGACPQVRVDDAGMP